MTTAAPERLSKLSPRRATHWTAADIALLQSLHKKVSPQEIASLLGRSEKAVVSKAKLLGLMSRVQCATEPGLLEAIRKLNAEGHNDMTIAKMLRRSHGSIVHHRTKLGLPGRRQAVDPDFLDAIRKLNSEGKNDAEIARLLGRSDSVIAHHRHKMGLPATVQRVPRPRVTPDGEVPWDGPPRDHDEVMRRAHLILAKYPRFPEVSGVVPWEVPGVRVWREELRAACEG